MSKIKWALVLALALLAVPASASATTTTVTPTGFVTANVNDPGAVLTADLGSLSCSSHATGDISNAATPSSGTLNTLDFTACTGAFGVTCIVTVNSGSLPRPITVVNGTATATSGANTDGDTSLPDTLNVNGTVSVTIDCDSNSSDCTVGATNAQGIIDDPNDTVRFNVTLTVNQSGGNCTSPPGWTATYALTVAGTATATTTGSASVTP